MPQRPDRGDGSVWSATVRVVLLWAAGLTAAGQFAKISVIFPQLAAAYPGADTAVGLLLSLISLLGVVFGMTAGVLVARSGPRRVLLAALVVGAVLSALQATLPPLWLMLASRVAEGAAHLAIVVAAPTLIARIAGPRGQPAALSLWSTFFAVAYALAAWLAPPLVAAFGAPGVLAAHAALMALAGLALALALPHDRREVGATRHAGGSIGDLAVQSVRAYRAPGAAAPASGWLCYTLVFVAVLTLLPPELPTGARAAMAAAMPLASVAVSLGLGVPLIGWLRAVRVVMIGFTLSACAAFALAIWPGAPAAAIALFAALGLVQGATFAAVPQLNAGAAAQARANGALAQSGNLGNLLGTPVLLVLIGWAGPGTLPVFAALCCAAGLIAHAAFARAAPPPPIGRRGGQGL